MLDHLLEKDLLPEWALRRGIRHLLAQRLRDEARRAAPAKPAYLARYADDLRLRAVAEQTAAANEQHYEVPARFFELCLGRRLKYSSCYFFKGTETLDEAEDAMLGLYVRRGELRDGQTILDLGCGWGSLSLYLAERFPHSRITGVSNSSSQREFILERAAERGLKNLRIITCDVNRLDLEPASFDRVLSVEMFEHMKNYERLLASIGRWLKPEGKLFVHIFTHDRFAYHFESRGPSDWMARHFFTGGQMPAHALLSHFQRDLRLVQDWRVNGRHYQQTAEHWLRNMERNRAEILTIFREVYGPDEARKWWAYWRIFYLSCAELWGYKSGSEWIVSHYLFQKPPLNCESMVES